MASPTVEIAPDLSDPKKEISISKQAASDCDKKLENVNTELQNNVSKCCASANIENANGLRGQVSNINQCSPAPLEEDTNSIKEDSPTSSRTDCTVVFRANSADATINGIDTVSSINELTGTQEKNTDETRSEFEDAQILCVKRLLSESRENSLGCRRAEESDTETKSDRASYRNATEIIHNSDGLIEIDLSDSQYEQLVARCCDGLACEHAKGKTKLPVSSRAEGVSAETMLSAQRSPENRIKRRNGDLERFNRCNHSSRPVLDAIALARSECESGSVLGYSIAGDNGAGGLRCNAVNEPATQLQAGRDFREVPMKMVFTSQRMKEYFETFRSRSGEKLRLYQFFKSTRTELVACLLLSLIVAQAQIVTRTEMQQRAHEWPFAPLMDASQDGNKQQQIDAATGKGFVHFANGLATAFTVASLTQVFGHVSGCHLLPSISLALYFKGHTSRARLASYLAAQSVGPFVGVALLSVLTSSQITPAEYRVLIARQAANMSQLEPLAITKNAPATGHTQLSSTTSAGSAQRLLQGRQQRRRRRHAISNEVVNGTISTSAAEPPSNSTAASLGDDDDDYLHEQVRRRWQQSQTEGSETILMSIEEQLKRQLELKRSQQHRPSVAIVATAAADRVADDNRPTLRPETGNLSAEGSGKTIRMGTLGSSSPPSTYVAGGDTGGGDGSGGGGWLEAKLVQVEANPSVHNRKEGSVSSDSSNKVSAAAPLHDEPMDAVSKLGSDAAPESSAGEPRASGSPSPSPELVLPVPVSPVPASPVSNGEGRVSNFAAGKSASVNRDPTTQSVSESIDGFGVAGLRLRRRKRNRLQTILAVSPAADRDNKEELQHQNWLINNLTGNGKASNNDRKSLRWQQQPVAASILPDSSPTLASTSTMPTRDTVSSSNNNNKNNNGIGRVDHRDDNNFFVSEHSQFEDYTTDNKDHNDHYINLLEFALPDKVMAFESIRQCISKQSLVQEQTELPLRPSNGINPVQLELGPASRQGTGFIANDNSDQLSADAATSTSSTSVPRKLSPSSGVESYLAGKSFHHCLLLSNGSQMFILQLVATLVVVLTYLVNVDPRRDDAGFKSFSIGLAYFVACILTVSTARVQSKPSRSASVQPEEVQILTQHTSMHL